jgi:hypothetical protein
MNVRVRGIYATALTATFEDVVQASPPIQRRFDESFPLAPAAVSIETTADRQGVSVVGTADRVADVVSQLQSVGRDALAWRATLPRDAVFAGEVVETLGSGALVECGEGPTPSAETDEASDSEDNSDDDPPVAGDSRGFLPYSKTARHVETGDTLRVQIAEPRPPWSNGRPVLETALQIQGELATLVRGGTDTGGQPELADILPAEPPDGWAVKWGRDADDADLDALSATLESLSRRATALDDAFADAPAPDESAPHCYWPGEATCWVWFGRESRFELDGTRRNVVPTMAGHHRIKAATGQASAAVDFVESVCDDVGEDDSFPFAAVTRQFGPTAGDSVHIGHGKPDGRYIDLGPGEVTERTADGQVTVRREMSPGGTYDALGIEREAGDEAITKFKEGRWWYPTVYRSSEGDSRGTYVNVCTPVEIFPEDVRYVDLHVDVVKHADGTVERVDDDELDGAVEAGTIPPALAEKARTVAEAVTNAL